jgi:hypothetical protein
MINSFNHTRVSLNTLYRWDQEDQEKNRTPKTLDESNKRPRLSKRLGWVCQECKAPTLIVDRENGEIACSSCGFVNFQLRNAQVDLGTQIESYRPEAPLSESHGLGSWVPYKDLLRLGLKHVSWIMYQSVKDASPRELRMMRRYTSKVLEQLPCFSSKSNEVMKARKAQVSKRAAEVIYFVYTESKKELEQSSILTDTVLKIDWKQFVPSILDHVLSCYLPEKHTALRDFKERFPADRTLQAKIEKLLTAQLQGENSSRESDSEKTILLEAA